MHKIVSKTDLNTQVSKITIFAENVCKKIKPGQFIIVRIDEKAERIPLTVFSADPKQGTIDIVVQKTGLSTSRLCSLNEGDHIQDLIGPLGMPSDIKKYGNVLCIAGGVGVAEIYPLAGALKDAGNKVDLIAGFQKKEKIILKEQLGAVSDAIYLTTDDGSFGLKGNVITALDQFLNKNSYDIVFTVGPVAMMKAVSEKTKAFNIKTIVSLNSIMVDGTGMCGSCRVTVGDKIKFVCVDGPDFDAALVDFDGLLMRQNRFVEQERQGGHRSCHLK